MLIYIILLLLIILITSIFIINSSSSSPSSLIKIKNFRCNGMKKYNHKKDRCMKIKCPENLILVDFKLKNGELYKAICNDKDKLKEYSIKDLPYDTRKEPHIFFPFKGFLDKRIPENKKVYLTNMYDKYVSKFFNRLNKAMINIDKISISDRDLYRYINAIITKLYDNITIEKDAKTIINMFTLLFNEFVPDNKITLGGQLLSKLPQENKTKLIPLLDYYYNGAFPKDY